MAKDIEWTDSFTIDWIEPPKFWGNVEPTHAYDAAVSTGGVLYLRAKKGLQKIEAFPPHRWSRFEFI